MKLKISVLFRCSMALMAAMLVFSVLPAGFAQARPLSATITETFANSTAPGWGLSGNACLTAGAGCPATPNNEGNGNGWLRLTDTGGNEAGSAIYNTAFSSTDGIQVSFDYATYGGSGADGFTFYLIDGSTVTPTVGAPGGSLGYSRRTAAPAANGVTNGYVGIGFDEYGNFSNTGYGDCTPSCPGQLSNSITIRGAGSLNTGFNYMARSNASIQTGSRVGKHSVRITVTPAPGPKITVEMDAGSGFVTYINAFDLSGNGAVPATFKMGFSSSTGGSTNFHEIGNFKVGGAQTANITLQQTTTTTSFGQSITFTATVSGGGSMPTGTVDFYDGGVFIGTGTLDGAGNATFSSSVLIIGSHSITARYSGNSYYGGIASSSVIHTIATATTLTSSSLPSTGFAPGMITKLPAQPADKAYTTYGNLWLEIPSQNVKMSIVGVPAAKDGWNVNWLGNSAGWLNGTAFPTWNGNSVITGHVWNADNTPGAFVNIKNLSYGDKILVHAYGSVYTYQVRDNFLAYNSSKVMKHFDTPWLTLLTCENYNTIIGNYSFHRAVQATLIKVAAEK